MKKIKTKKAIIGLILGTTIMTMPVVASAEEQTINLGGGKKLYKSITYHYDSADLYTTFYSPSTSHGSQISGKYNGTAYTYKSGRVSPGSTSNAKKQNDRETLSTLYGRMSYYE
ncbi:MAG: hypothetical protein ACLR02_07450 [Clostridium sp.]|jgi:hypothetical protein|nr:hypothetical protein [Clostridium sp.]